jgi:hypothetical protein
MEMQGVCVQHDQTGDQAMNNDVPCRVMADLARHESELRDHIPESFDHTDDMHVGAVVPYVLVEPTMDILSWRQALTLLNGKPLSAESQAELLKDMNKFYAACAETWRDL